MTRFTRDVTSRDRDDVGDREIAAVQAKRRHVTSVRLSRYQAERSA